MTVDYRIGVRPHRDNDKLRFDQFALHAKSFPARIVTPVRFFFRLNVKQRPATLPRRVDLLRLITARGTIVLATCEQDAKLGA